MNRLFEQKTHGPDLLLLFKLHQNIGRYQRYTYDVKRLANTVEGYIAAIPRPPS